MDDLDCVDDQHSHGKSVGKYHMVNRVKTLIINPELIAKLCDPSFL